MKKESRKLFRQRIAVLLASVMLLSSTSVTAFADPTDETTASETNAAESTVDAVDESEVSEPDSEVTDSDTESTDSDTDSTEDPSKTNYYTSEDIHATGEVNMIRLYNASSGEHFYTSNLTEAKNLRDIGWKYESIGWVAPKSSDKPVYRLYNPNSGDHHYTMSEEERDNLAKIGWRYEGIGWYSDGMDKIPLYRQFNPNEKIGTHNYTTSIEENNILVNAGWNAEGIGWYAAGASKPKDYSLIAPQTIYNGIDYSDIYDYDYFISANPSLQSKFGNKKDEDALAYFVHTAMWNGTEAKSGMNYLTTAYKEHRYKVKPELRQLDTYTSSTGYLITVNLSTHVVNVYQGRQYYDWKNIYSTRCTTGAASTPTYKGVFKTRRGGYYFDSGSVRCFYYTPFNGGIYFHSVLYAQTSTPSVIMDGRLGYNISHGCVRLPLNAAYYIYNNFGTKNIGTTVVVF